MWLKALFLFQKFKFSRVIAMSAEENEDIRQFHDCTW